MKSARRGQVKKRIGRRMGEKRRRRARKRGGFTGKRVGQGWKDG